MTKVAQLIFCSNLLLVDLLNDGINRYSCILKVTKTRWLSPLLNRQVQLKFQSTGHLKPVLLSFFLNKKCQTYHFVFIGALIGNLVF